MRWANIRSAFAPVAAVLVACTSAHEPQWNPISAEDTRQLLVFSHVNASGYLGHGFVLARDGHQPLGLTTYAVANLGGDTSPSDADGTRAWLRTVVDSTKVFRLGERLTVTGAHTVTTADSQHDIAAFSVLDFDATRALELAPAMPSVGDTVYVLAMHFGDSPLDGPRRHPALVLVSSNAELQYVYLASSNTYLTNGAAVLDHGGRVVGVHVAAFVSGPQVHGIAVGANSLRAILPD